MAKKIRLTQGKFALVDDADFEWLNQWKWCILKGRYTYYAIRTDRTIRPRRTVQMHRQILGLIKGDSKNTDHQNRNGLDNRRANLRTCTRAENAQNKKKQINCTSKFKGVCLHKRRKKRKWQAYICYNNKLNCLGYFTNQVEAAHAYDEAAAKYFGEFAKLNFPNKPKQRKEQGNAKSDKSQK